MLERVRSLLSYINHNTDRVGVWRGAKTSNCLVLFQWFRNICSKFAKFFYLYIGSDSNYFSLEYTAFQFIFDVIICFVCSG